MGAFFRHNLFFHHPFSEFSKGSMYGAYVVNYKQDLILENLNSFIYFYLIFLPECQPQTKKKEIFSCGSDATIYVSLLTSHQVPHLYI